MQLLLIASLLSQLLLKTTHAQEAVVIPEEHAQDRVIVKFEDGTSWLGKQWTYISNGTRPTADIGDSGVEVLSVPEDSSPAEVIAKLSNESNIEFVEPDIEIPSATAPNDPQFPNAWHHGKIKTPDAWDIGKANGIKVAVCDSGVDGNHPDLKNVLETGLGYNTFENNTNWGPHGMNQHGTRVAGAVAAETNNGLFVAGIAWGARIIPIRITHRLEGDTAYTFTSDIVECITYAADNGAKVINISYTAGESSAIRNAANYAESKGALTVMSVGNENKEVSYTNHPSITVVSATNTNDAKASFSNWGSPVDVSAPGDGIQTVWTTESGTFTSGLRSGTSYSAPVTAGVIALMAGANPQLTVQQLKSILVATADDLGSQGYDPVFGNGRINAQKAIQAAEETTPISGKSGDANNDQVVDGKDYVVWLNNYQTVTTSGPTKGDFNTDGVIDGKDYVVWLNNYQK